MQSGAGEEDVFHKPVFTQAALILYNAVALDAANGMLNASSETAIC